MINALAVGESFLVADGCAIRYEDGELKVRVLESIADEIKAKHELDSLIPEGTERIPASNADDDIHTYFVNRDGLLDVKVKTEHGKRIVSINANEQLVELLRQVKEGFNIPDSFNPDWI